MSTFSDFDFNTGVQEEEEEEVMTPQKQFLLLSQSLRLPDGSSNPDLFDCPEPPPPPPAGSKEDLLSEKTEKNLNLSLCVRQAEAAASQLQPRKKSELTFASKFKLFFTKRKKEKCKTTIDKRSKSCDRDLEEICKKENKTPAIRSASCSPLKQRAEQREPQTPVASCLSLAPTEWEFHLQDALNGNTSVTSNTANTAGVGGDRKSSGYDSLEGESSSIDSNQEVSQGNTLKYALPNDNKSVNSAMQYDDISVLKNEIRRYPNILRRAY